MIQKIFYKILPSILLGLLLGLVIRTAPVLAKQITAPTIKAANASSISRNWSGYTATGGKFTGAGGSWVVPNSSGSGTSSDATWVGIGGIADKDLVQAGTQTIFTTGHTSYQAWYELLPAGSHKVPLAINPGDSVTISISQQPNGQWEIFFRNNTSSQNYQTSVTYNSSLSSAEWIEEAPSIGRSVISLDNFGSVQFSDLWTVKNGAKVNPSQAGAKPINMANSFGQVLAQTSTLGNDGASFTISRNTPLPQQVSPPYKRGGATGRLEMNTGGFRSPYGYIHIGGRFGGWGVWF